jgi:hypothetical protein
VADAPPWVLAALGTRRDPLAGRFTPPDEATIRCLLERVDAAALNAAVSPWLAARLHAGGRHAIADGRGGRWRWTARRRGYLARQPRQASCPPARAETVYAIISLAATQTTRPN